MEKHVLKIEFDNKEALEHFAHWLCDQGEQDYWLWQEYREQEEDGDITALKFKYHYENKFLGDGTIRTECGRMDKR